MLEYRSFSVATFENEQLPSGNPSGGGFHSLSYGKHQWCCFSRGKEKTSSLNFPLSFLLSRPPRAAFLFVPLKLVHFRKEKSLFSLSAMRTAQATKDMESFKLYNSLHSGGHISLETGPSFDHGGPP